MTAAIDETISDFAQESNEIEGIYSGEALVAHIAALRAFLADPVTIDSLIAFVAAVQPNARFRDRWNVPCVRVGNHIAPPSGPAIRERLTEILQIVDPWEQHCAYETLHPFTDGNGRSGRALWLHRHNGHAPLLFLHSFYYQTLARVGR